MRAFVIDVVLVLVALSVGHAPEHCTDIVHVVHPTPRNYCDQPLEADRVDCQGRVETALSAGV